MRIFFECVYTQEHYCTTESEKGRVKRKKYITIHLSFAVGPIEQSGYSFLFFFSIQASNCSLKHILIYY